MVEVMGTTEELRLEVERLKEALRKKERENENLIDELRELKNGMEEMEKRMEDRMVAKLDDIMRERFASEVGGGAKSKRTSTPRIDRQKTKSEEPVKNGLSDVDEDEDEEKMKKKKKKTSKQRRHERRMKAKSKSIDSLYSSSDEGVSEDGGSGSSESSESGIQVKRSVLIRDIPKINKFNVYGTKDVFEFFKDYEGYCKEKFDENRVFWVKELGEFLEGRMLDFYKAIVSVGEPKYEVVKQRILDQVRRVKAGVKYRKVNDFDKARRGKNERIDMYAHRLETLARKKFGDEDVDGNKRLLKKFLETVPPSVTEYVNLRRKEKMRWSGERLRWEDVLEIVEDREFEGNEREENERRDVYSGRGMTERASPPPQYRSYRDALKANPYEVMVKFLEDFYGGSEERLVNVGDVNANVSRQIGGNVNVRRNDMYNQGSGRQGNVTNRENVNKIVKCFRCGKTGHMISECRWANGTCFSCGQVGHMAMNCTDPQRSGCRRCGGLDHWVRDCPQGVRMTQLVCGNCGIEGHFSRMCRSPRNTCNRCGKLGHVGEMCWSVRQPGRGSQVNPGVNDGGSGIGSNVQAIGSQAIGSSNRNVNLGTSGVNSQVRLLGPGNEYEGGLQMVNPQI